MNPEQSPLSQPAQVLDEGFVVSDVETLAALEAASTLAPQDLAHLAAAQKRALEQRRYVTGEWALGRTLTVTKVEDTVKKYGRKWYIEFHTDDTPFVYGTLPVNMGVAERNEFLASVATNVPVRLRVIKVSPLIERKRRRGRPSFGFEVVS